MTWARSQALDILTAGYATVNDAMVNDATVLTAGPCFDYICFDTSRRFDYIAAVTNLMREHIAPSS